MYVFFEPHWKLHPGKIPEKPEHDILKLNTWVAQRNYDLAIAAIKQNALTVGNPEILKQFGYLELPINGDFVNWPGGYETIKCSTCGKEWNDETSWYCSNSFHLKAPAVATLTPPHEKTLNA